MGTAFDALIDACRLGELGALGVGERTRHKPRRPGSRPATIVRGQPDRPLNRQLRRAAYRVVRSFGGARAAGRSRESEASD